MTLLPPHVQVCLDPATSQHFLRVHLHTEMTGTLRFESERAYSKREADLRAVMLSVRFGWDRDELPTHPLIAAYPPVAAPS